MSPTNLSLFPKCEDILVPLRFSPVGFQTVQRSNAFAFLNFSSAEDKGMEGRKKIRAAANRQKRPLLGTREALDCLTAPAERAARGVSTAKHCDEHDTDCYLRRMIA